MKNRHLRYPFYLLAILLGTVCLALIAWEIVLRLGHEVPALNSWGFHDVEPDFPPTARPRVLVLGDSFVEGIAVPVERLIGPRLKDKLGPNAAVVALGRAGAGQATELDLLLEYAPRVRPQVVVLVFVPSNDVLNNSPDLEPKKTKPFYVLQDGELVRVPPAEAAARARSRLRVVDEIRRRRAVLRQKRDLLNAGGGIPLDFLVYRPAQTPPWEDAWATTFALLERLERMVLQQGARFLLAVAAERAAVDPRTWEEMERAYQPLQENRWSARGPARRLLEWCAKNEVAAVDLYPAFTAGDPDRLLLRDGHWSAAGHALAAQVIAEALGGSVDFPLRTE